MIGDGVLAGDKIVVLRQEARPEDIVVARFLNETTGAMEATVKRYRQKEGGVG